jgi:hypothetical protein
MSSFPPEWLALREPADLSARSRKVLTACQRHFDGRPSVRICDTRTQEWTLVDNDGANLAAAENRLAEWAIATRRPVTLRMLVRDFAREPDCWPPDTELVTASALLDLASSAWIAKFVRALAARRLPLLATLTVDGEFALDPAQEFDDAIFATFAEHQARDKGFGPAAGGDAPAHLEEALITAGYTIVADDSPWRIDRSQAGLLHAVLAGIAAAVHETGRLPAKDIEQWLRGAATQTALLTVGHRDVFATL